MFFARNLTFWKSCPAELIKQTPYVLLSYLNIAREEVIAIGDGVCDVNMLQVAGLGIAMGHAQDSVKVCADYVTASNEEDGVAQSVEKLILAESACC